MNKKEEIKLHISLHMVLEYALRNSTKVFIQKCQSLGLDVSIDQWLVLGQIWKHKSISQKQISTLCVKDKTSITKIINTLEKKNLLVRIIDQIDHRIKRVVLTNKGNQLFLDALPIMENTKKIAEKDIDKYDLEIAKVVLQKIGKNLNTVESATKL